MVKDVTIKREIKMGNKIIINYNIKWKLKKELIFLNGI